MLGEHPTGTSSTQPRRHHVFCSDRRQGRKTIDSSNNTEALIVTVGARPVAIPLRHVSEVMRALPTEHVAGSPAFVVGISVIRGGPVPVVDLGALLENVPNRNADQRLVTLQVGERRLALLVDGVVGLRRLDATRLEDLPSMLTASNADLIEAVSTADAQLLVVLRAARVIPEAVWATLAPAEAAR
jgi:purine-binding chemotaxis protein CheW